MHCPSLTELPLPPPDKKGWPWTEESPSLPQKISDGSSWPRISIVTPSFNQGMFIEETIRSVLLQGYPDLEYIIIDGGSTDGTVDIIRKYEKWIAYWVSQPDKGQSNAINKGFNIASGEILAFINSDDLYEYEVFGVIAEEFIRYSKPHLLVGEWTVFRRLGRNRWESVLGKPWWPKDMEYFLSNNLTFCQAASFWTKQLHHQVGGFDESLQFCFDRDFFLKIGLLGIKPTLLSCKIAKWRFHKDNKSTKDRERFFEDAILILRKHGKFFFLSEHEIASREIEIQSEMRYLKVLMRWKGRGRLMAALEFVKMIVSCPNLLLKRKILGLGRRLLTFKSSDVVELQRLW